MVRLCLEGGAAQVLRPGVTGCFIVSLSETRARLPWATANSRWSAWKRWCPSPVIWGQEPLNSRRKSGPLRQYAYVGPGTHFVRYFARPQPLQNV